MRPTPPPPSRSADPIAASLLPEALNQGWLYRDRIGASQAGLRVVEYYAGRYHHSGREIWRERLAAGQIQRNGCPLLEDAPLQAGDRLRWRRPAWREPSVPAAWRVVHDDGDLLVIDKPSGLPVLPAGGFLEHTLLRLLERRHQQDPAGVPRPVHRLGRFTSGLLVCARHPTTRARLSQQLRESTAAGPSHRSPNHRALPPAGDASEHRPSTDGDGGDRPVRKLYRALLLPAVLALEPGQTIAIDHPIGRRPHPKLGWIWCAAQEAAGALPAHSRLTLLERHPEADLVQVAIASGRPHQIRIHAAAIGAPLLGDPLYRPGGQAAPDALPGEGGYRLQAWRLELPQADGSWLALQVPEPLQLAAVGLAPGEAPSLL